MIHIKKIPERPSQQEIDAIAKFSPATLHEAQGRRGALSSRIKPVDYRMKLCGPAFTVKSAPRDNIMLQLAINYAQPGDIIVVSGGEYEEAGSFGDVLANACLAKGIGGLVTDTGVRDTLQLRDLGFPVFSLSVCIKGTVKETLTEVNDPIVIGDELVYPGDIIVGDADGVVVVRRQEAMDVAALAQTREDAEAGYIAAYKAGKSVIEVSNLEPVLRAKGFSVEA
ncbi:MULTISPECIES: 4-carboxy-4-hydroxy-2-oxoadipate aldolase/oxaloacetate decarboxylase [Rhizobium/Agrobacterium group]|uniref:4-carboxy-4-hydroxy-2-oxoadipate aldolase/oxaloacetate decarboxylase n=1 Tax=Rhizobium/Agrobacterium group TaxID=227290 RepID=UPI000B3FE4B4|nr:MULTISPECIES: 4-carboxy-4-hydroxy-2-oxoadipate aldolase/oxaloacetate decarboxylase [Rhizobium/Agrobacterium group]MCF1485399.1 4-carboxy-4-hydroxy-2-oxoadipate aldolase/oxaloacetate decarboxylase [Allorhizobium ampelinum]NSZ45681.1 4-carboxy-4-hydroxy-2-oxoadipate aldolase/oxaloacetate decarboxylase [Agrobacterium vitis]NTA29859.1 4-carboxy-4-hydroxy-2-oxoadipate aldolase/oxaloacetate decarboxylase [Allorhizobium ampelinum]OVE87559.1 S-adenosylmethionine--2-demethylmenaquinone methyltransfer